MSSGQRGGESPRLSQVLFNENRYAILAFLLNNPDSQYSIAEIQDEVEVSRPVISEFVDQLRDLGLVQKARKGPMYLISINRHSPYYDRLQDLLELDAEPLRESAQHIADELIANYNIASIYLYGSAARGTPKTDSDLDLLIIERDDLSDSEKSEAESFIRKQADQWKLTLHPMWMDEEDIEYFGEEMELPMMRDVKEEGIHLAGEELW